MLEPVTPVPNAVGQRSRPARSRQEWPRPVGNADARGQPVIVIGSPGDIPRALEHPAVENGRFHVKAALAIETQEKDMGSAESLETRLLSDCKVIWRPGENWLASKLIIERLCLEIPDSPWSDYRGGRQITQDR